MTDEEKALVSSAAKGAAEGLMKGAPPVYKDTIQPAAQEIGQGLANIMKILLFPTNTIAWSIDGIASWFNPKLEEKLTYILPENLVPAKLSIAGPALEAVRFLEEEESLRDLYITLIATSMDATRRNNALPSYIEIIKNLSGNDALVLKYFMKNEVCAYLDVFVKTPYGEEILGGTYVSLMLEEIGVEMPANGLESIINLQRLGLIVNPENIMLTDDSYKKINENPNIREMFKLLPQSNLIVSRPPGRRVHQITALGLAFTKACMWD